MKKTMVASLVLAFCGMSYAPVAAQSFLTTPPGGLKKEGRHGAYVFGVFHEARFQQADGEHRGKKVQIDEIAFRLDYQKHNSQTAMGRTWTKITLHMSEFDMGSMSSSFKANINGTPTKVFDGKQSWPTHVGFPASSPSAWSDPGGALRFPFTKPWLYSGKQDLLMDYVFLGGTLANKRVWDHQNPLTYYLDSEHLLTTTATGAVSVPPTSYAPRCTDSANTPGFKDAVMFATSAAHGPVDPIVTFRGKLRVQHYSIYMAPNAPSVTAIGLGGTSNQGIEVGARCNRLAVDLSKPHLFVNFPTNQIGHSGIMIWLFPWSQAFAGGKLFLQGAWSDSRTKRLSLTKAAWITLPSVAPVSRLPRYKTVLQLSPSASSGNIPKRDAASFPFTRYRTR